MPQSRNNRKNGKSKQTSHNDKRRIHNAFNMQFDKYELMQEHELLTLRDSGTVKGTYLDALHAAIKLKQNLKDKQKEHDELVKDDTHIDSPTEAG